MHLVGEHPGGVEDVLPLKYPLGGGDGVAPLHGGDGGGRGGAVERYAIDHRHLCHGQGVLPGVHNAGGGSVESAHHVLAEIGLFLAHLGGVQQLQPRHPVLNTPVVEGAQGVKVPLIKGQYQAAYPGKGHLELLADVPGHPVSLHVELCHEGARLRVVPGVDDGAVGLGSAVCHVVLGFQHGHIQGIPGQVVGGGSPHHPTWPSGRRRQPPPPHSLK